MTVTSSLQLATTGRRQDNWLGNGKRTQMVTITGTEGRGHDGSSNKNKSNKPGRVIA
jgi:hypothetical protein